MKDPAPRSLGVLFVCYGNTCRSPLAHGIFRAKLAEAGLDESVTVDSAGTHAPGAGGPPHPLALAVAARHGVDIGDLRARRFDPAADFDRFDRIVVLDSANRRDVLGHARGDRDAAKVRLLRDGQDVADPIVGGEEHYERAYAEIDAACDELLRDVRATL